MTQNIRSRQKLKLFDMKKFIKFFFLLYLFFIATDIKAQSISTSLGFAGFGSPIDGYYFSFDYDIKLNKTFSIAPTFSFISNMKFAKGHYAYISETNILRYNNLKVNTARQAGLAELYVYLHPLQFFKKINLDKNELKIGFGFGISAHTFIVFHKDNNGNIALGSTYGIFPSYSSKLIYNYHLKNYFFGITLGVTDLMAYGTSLIGINLGAKLY